MPENSIRDRVENAPVEPVPITMIELDPNNPVRKFDDLVDDVRRHGVLQAVLVRPVAGDRKSNRFHLVAGHRRVCAASAAGLSHVPARIVSLEDHEAVELQAVENLQREDLHPLDECAVYERLLAAVDGGVAEVAARVGRPESHVYQRLALKGLPASAAKLLRAGELELTVALALARIPDPGVRESAAREVVKVINEWSGPAGETVRRRMSAAEAVAFIRSRFMLKLADAPFDRADLSLVPEAGACGPCPKRTGGNGVGLFGDLVDAGATELCTDGKCYERKVAASWERKAEKYRAEGHEVLDAKASRKVFDKFSPTVVAAKSGWADVDDAPNYYTDRTWRSLLGKAGLPAKLTYALDRDGKPRALAKRSTLEALAKKAGVTISSGYSSSRGASKPSAAERLKQKRELYRRKLVALARPSVLRTFAASALKPSAVDDVLRAAIADLEERTHGRTMKEHGRVTPAGLVLERAAAGGGKKDKTVAALSARFTGRELVSLLAELIAAARMLDSYREHEWGDGTATFATALGVDLKALELEAVPLVPERYRKAIERAAEKTSTKAKGKKSKPAGKGKAATSRKKGV